MNLYIRLQTQVLTDAKILAAGPEATLLWIKGLLYAKEHLTDGFVPVGVLPLIGIGLTDVKKCSQTLVECGLWHEIDGGYTVGIDRWGRHQTTKSQVEESRESARDRQAKSRANRHKPITDMSQPCHKEVRLPETETETETENIENKKNASATPPSASSQPQTESQALTPNLADVILQGEILGISQEECENFWHWHERDGWKTRHGVISNWKSALISWKNNKTKAGGTPFRDQHRRPSAEEMADQAMKTLGIS